MKIKFSFNFINWKMRKLIQNEIIKFYWFPHFEWNHSYPKSGQDPVYNHEYNLYILWGWGGIIFNFS